MFESILSFSLNNPISSINFILLIYLWKPISLHLQMSLLTFLTLHGLWVVMITLADLLWILGFEKKLQELPWFKKIYDHAECLKFSFLSYEEGENASKMPVKHTGTFREGPKRWLRHWVIYHMRTCWETWDCSAWGSYQCV